jgi:hypothetical protein
MVKELQKKQHNTKKSCCNIFMDLFYTKSRVLLLVMKLDPFFNFLKEYYIYF